MSLAVALQLADSALPIGRFAHSLGLEAWLDANREVAEDELLELVAAVVATSVAPFDGAAVARAHAARDIGELLVLDRFVHARKLAPGAREASAACGRGLATLVPTFTSRPAATQLAAATTSGATPGHLPVVSGALSAAVDLDVESAVLLELRGTAAALLSAAVRLGRLSALRAQVLQRELVPTLVEATAAAIERAAGGSYSSAIELELAQLAHRRTGGRQFIT